MRLDKYLVDNGFVESRNRANILLEKGLVLVNGKTQKPSYQIKENDVVNIKENIKYVSMGGYKLEKALNEFNISLLDKICADIGCSKGGFSECMLNFSAKKVYAVDVSISELDVNLYNDKKVVPLEINAKDLKSSLFEDIIDFIAVDCSFISVKNIINSLINILSQKGEMVILLKPQFECGAKNLTKGGIVKNKKILLNICEEFLSFFTSLNFSVLNFSYAPIRENKNVEFLFYLSRQGESINKEIIKGKLNELI